MTILWKAFGADIFLVMALNGSRGKHKNNHHAFSVSACKNPSLKNPVKYYEEIPGLYIHMEENVEKHKHMAGNILFSYTHATLVIVVFPLLNCHHLNSGS